MKDTRVTRTLLTGGAVGGVLFIVAFFMEGAIRADYSAFRYPISSLSIGDLGWLQVANFIITGLLILGFAFGLRRALSPATGSTWGPLLIGLAGIGLLGAGLFTTDPVYGYPPQAPLLLAQESLPGRLHDLFSALVFLGLPIACFVFSRRFFSLGQQGWAISSTCCIHCIYCIYCIYVLDWRQDI